MSTWLVAGQQEKTRDSSPMGYQAGSAADNPTGHSAAGKPVPPRVTELNNNKMQQHHGAWTVSDLDESHGCTVTSPMSCKGTTAMATA